METILNQINEEFILIVDDTSVNLEYLVYMLRDAGYKISSAKSGQLALESIKTIPPILILLDIMMPGMDGYEVCRRLKADEKTSSIPIIFISALEDKKYISQGFQFGAVDYITKPFTPAEVLARVKVHFDLRRMQLTLETQNANLKQEKKERELAVRKMDFEQDLIKAIMDNVPGAIYFKDLESRFIKLNRYFAIRLQNPDPDSYIGLTDINIFSQKHAQQALEDEQTIIKTGKAIIDIEEEETYPDKPSTWVLTSKMPFFDKNGQIIGTFGISIDITERKQAELKLLEKQKKIDAQNQEYQQINEELSQTNKELLFAKKRAEENDRLKTAFLQNMSHEIRTPLNAIMGFSEILPKYYYKKVQLKQYSEIINQSCSDLLDIINEIFDIAKIETSQLSVNFETCNLNSLFAELSLLFKDYQKRFNKQHIKLNTDVHCDPSASIITTDKAKLRQILINLISNAFKFTEKGKINVGCKLDPNQNLLFYVMDTGIGIPFEKQNFIFESFTRLDHGKERLYGGTGLGLPIAKGLIHLLGGKIWLESELGKGTTFYFSTPYKSATPKQSIALETETSKEFNFSGQIILIVEDDNYNTLFIKELLKDKDLSILNTPSGYEAIKISLSEPLDLILMDIRLPDIDGYEAARQIKQQKPDLVIIAETAYAAHDDRQKALDAGCDDYINKPIMGKLLLTMMLAHLGKK